MRLSLARLIFTLVMSVMLVTAASGSLPGVNSTAPDFALKSTSGENVRLSEFRSEVVLVTFWASWCRSCRTSIPKLVQMHAGNTDEDFHIVAVSLDEDSEVTRRVTRELGIPFPVLSDDKHTVAELYDLPDLPVTLLLDRKGNVRFVHRGYESGDETLYAGEAAALLAE